MKGNLNISKHAGAPEGTVGLGHCQSHQEIRDVFQQIGATSVGGTRSQSVTCQTIRLRQQAVVYDETIVLGTVCHISGSLGISRKDGASVTLRNRTVSLQGGERVSRYGSFAMIAVLASIIQFPLPKQLPRFLGSTNISKCENAVRERNKFSVVVVSVI